MCLILVVLGVVSRLCLNLVLSCVRLRLWVVCTLLWDCVRIDDVPVGYVLVGVYDACVTGSTVSGPAVTGSAVMAAAEPSAGLFVLSVEAEPGHGDKTVCATVGEVSGDVIWSLVTFHVSGSPG